jgi:hypothetical protein
MLRLVVQAWIGLLVFDVARRLGFARIHALLRRCHTAHRRIANQHLAEQIVWAVDEACVWYVTRAACLQRSVVATWLLRRHGIDAELVIGYRSLPFESHAWVEVGGVVVNDRQQYKHVFATLERL